MMGEQTVMKKALFYSFSLEDHFSQDHLMSSIDRPVSDLLQHPTAAFFA